MTVCVRAQLQKCVGTICDFCGYICLFFEFVPWRIWPALAAMGSVGMSVSLEGSADSSLRTYRALLRIYMVFFSNLYHGGFGPR